jgi:Flp pilus assembly protein TadD
LAGELVTNPQVRVEGHLLKSRVALAKEQLAEARVALETAIAEFPGDVGTLRESSNFFFHHGTDEEGERALRALLAREPSDAGAYHSLGVVLMRTNRHEEAVVVYRQSLRYRPNFWPTFFNLSYALTDGDRLTEAKAACEQAARLAPNEPGPRRELAWIARMAAGGHGSWCGAGGPCGIGVVVASDAPDPRIGPSFVGLPGGG